MITTALIYMLIGLASPLRALQNATLPAELTSSITSIGRSLRDLNGMFPVTTLFTIIGLFITIELAILLFKIVKLIIKR